MKTDLQPAVEPALLPQEAKDESVPPRSGQLERTTDVTQDSSPLATSSQIELLECMTCLCLLRSFFSRTFFHLNVRAYKFLLAKT